MWKPTIAILAVFSAGCLSNGQPAQKLKFEVASVKAAATRAGRSASITGGPGSHSGGDRISCQYVTLERIVEIAYDLKRFRVIGPNWLDSNRYDIVANLPPGTTLETRSFMFQDLLEERFHLKLHHESREFPVYNLLIAKGGPKLKRSERVDRGAIVSGPLPTGGKDARGIRVTPEQLTHWLSRELDGWDVLDKTGLTGLYDFDFDYAPVANQVNEAAFSSPSVTGPGAAAPPSLFTALQQELGLRLEKSKGMYDVIVIDQLDKTPSEN